MKSISAVQFLRRVLNATEHSDQAMFLARECILEHQTYRLPESAKYDRWIAFKTIYRGFIHQSDEKAIQTLQRGNDLVITGPVSGMKSRLKYVESLGVQPAVILAKERLATHWRKISFLSQVGLLTFAMTQALICLLRAEERQQRALLFTALIEAQLLAIIIEREEIDVVHDFAQFEIDSNFTFLYLKQLFPDLNVKKYPSPGPLSLHNQTLLADALCFNTPYHLDEVKSLPNIHVDQLQQVPPEGYLEYANCYGSDRRKHSFTLGYYSHGSWVRKMDGDSDDGLGILNMEERVLHQLHALLEKNQEWSLKLYTHPRERVPLESISQEGYYRDFFRGNQRVQISPADSKRSSQLFDECDVGVGVYSTILFERLYCGFKTIIVSPADWFPIKDSSLNQVTIHGTEDLEAQIINAQGKSDRAFMHSIGWEQKMRQNDSA